MLTSALGAPTRFRPVQVVLAICTSTNTTRSRGSRWRWAKVMLRRRSATARFATVCALLMDARRRRVRLDLSGVRISPSSSNVRGEQVGDLPTELVLHLFHLRRASRDHPASGQVWRQRPPLRSRPASRQWRAVADRCGARADVFAPAWLQGIDGRKGLEPGGGRKWNGRDKDQRRNGGMEEMDQKNKWRRKEEGQMEARTWNWNAWTSTTTARRPGFAQYGAWRGQARTLILERSSAMVRRPSSVGGRGGVRHRRRAVPSGTSWRGRRRFRRNFLDLDPAVSIFTVPSPPSTSSGRRRCPRLQDYARDALCPRSVRWRRRWSGADAGAR